MSVFEDRGPEYGFFFDPSDHIDELLAEGRVQDASDVFSRNRSWFMERLDDDDVLDSMGKLCRALHPFKVRPAEVSLAVLQGMEWPVGPDKWDDMRLALDEGEARLTTLKAEPILNVSPCTPEVRDLLQAELAAWKGRLERSAGKAFQQYPLPLEQSFFKVYPIFLDQQTFWEGNVSCVKPGLSHLGSKELEQAYSLYSPAMNDEGHHLFAERFFQLSLPSGAGQASLMDIVAAYKKARGMGMRVENVPNVKFAFIHATCDTLIRKRLIDFPISFDLDIPFNAVKAEGKHPYQSAAVKGADFVIIVNIALAKNDRFIEKTLPISSTFQNGVTRVPNPRFDILRMELQNATLAALGQTDPKAFEKEVADFKERLRTTPAFIEEPVFESYEYMVADVFVKKTATVHYYIIDRRARTYFTDTFDIQSNNAFKVVYNLHPFDIDKGKKMEDLAAEKDVVNFEESPIPVPISSLLGHCAESDTLWHSYADLEGIRKQIVEQQNVVLNRELENDFGFNRNQDIRFESVVKISNGAALGSGFYVADDMVLTNYHVVEGAQFVELKLWNEHASFGRVIAQDARLDLALIKVQERGRPVHFYSERFLPLGATVEAIGHPRGYDFTISRGIVSTVRKHSSITTVKGKPVLFVQTDCPINAGNSGGPLFMGGSVIGVNDFGVMKSQAEGLNFAVHYSEVFKFLKQHGVEYLMEVES